MTSSLSIQTLLLLPPSLITYSIMQFCKKKKRKKEGRKDASQEMDESIIDSRRRLAVNYKTATTLLSDSCLS